MSKGYKKITGLFDFMTKKIRKSIEEEKEEGKAFGIGVYSKNYCEEHLHTCPLKTDGERLQIAKHIKGVDFVFILDSKENVDEIAEAAYNEFIRQEEISKKDKKYKIGFTIGSFDVFHAGHLENILLASEQCKNLYVVVKTDERIIANKHKVPLQTTEERAEVLRNIKGVKDVLYMDIDSTRESVLEDVIEEYKSEYPDDELDLKNEVVVVYAEDLIEKEKGKWPAISTLVTPRSKEKMERVSSTAYQKIIMENGEMSDYTKLEDDNLQKYNDDTDKLK